MKRSWRVNGDLSINWNVFLSENLCRMCCPINIYTLRKKKNQWKRQNLSETCPQPEGKTRQHMKQLSSFKIRLLFLFLFTHHTQWWNYIKCWQIQHTPCFFHYSIPYCNVPNTWLSFFLTIFLFDNKAETKQGSSEHWDHVLYFFFF